MNKNLAEINVELQVSAYNGLNPDTLPATS